MSFIFDLVDAMPYRPAPHLLTDMADRGRHAYWLGWPRSKCPPFIADSWRDAWFQGWDAAHEENVASRFRSLTRAMEPNVYALARLRVEQDRPEQFPDSRPKSPEVFGRKAMRARKGKGKA